MIQDPVLRVLVGGLIHSLVQNFEKIEKPREGALPNYPFDANVPYRNTPTAMPAITT